jgi:two-component system sensor histidine kinase QseC
MRSIRAQLSRDLFYALAVLVVLGLAGIYVAVWDLVVDSFDATLRAQAMAVASLTEFEHGKVDYDFSDDFLASYGGKRPRNYFEMWDAAGRRLTRSPSLKEADLPWKPGDKPEKPRLSDVTLPNGRPGRLIAFTFFPTVPVDAGGPGPSPLTRLVVAVDREDLNESLGGLLAAVAGCAVLLTASVFVVVPRVLKRGLRPLEELGEQTAAIDANSLAVRFPTDRLPAELRPVSQRLNDLLARLEASFERERRFSADLAHELRTPLAELRSLAECALKWPESRDPATDRDALAIACQMETLVTHLLALARGDQGVTAAALRETPLEPLVREAWSTFATRAEEKKLHVTLELAPATATTDAALLRSVLNNLFDNAVSYTPAEGEVSIALRTESRGAVIEVANAPVDLTEGDATQLFDRFWRKEAARSDHAHLGLGLSLSRSFATTIGWTLSAKLTEGQRLVFTLRR